MASEYTSGSDSRTSKRRGNKRVKYAFELIDHNSQHVIMEFNSRRQALSETCLWIKANPGANTDVSLVFRDANTNEVHFSAAGNELEELCRDEVQEMEDDLG